MKNDALHRFAHELGLTIKQDVFHGSTGVELRKYTRRGVICVGFIQGNAEVEIYTRQFKRLDALVHDTLWPLGNFLRRFGLCSGGNYRCLARLKSAEFNLARFIALAQNEFSSWPSE